MPFNRTSSQQSFNTGLLEPEALTTRGGLQAALRSIESVCFHDDSSIMDMVVELSSRPHILEYIFSSTFCTLVIIMGLIDECSSSIWRSTLREIIEVDCCPVPYVLHTRRDGRFWHPTASATILFPNACRKGCNSGTTQRTQGTPKECGDVSECLEGAQWMRRPSFGRCKRLSNQS
jgi:hypothetical protein